MGAETQLPLEGLNDGVWSTALVCCGGQLTIG